VGGQRPPLITTHAFLHAFNANWYSAFVNLQMLQLCLIVVSPSMAMNLATTQFCI
jgi:hypothetical protein